MVGCLDKVERLWRKERACLSHSEYTRDYGHHRPGLASCAHHRRVLDACLVLVVEAQGIREHRQGHSESSLDPCSDAQAEEGNRRSWIGGGLALWCSLVSARYYGLSSLHKQSHREDSCCLWYV